MGNKEETYGLLVRCPCGESFSVDPCTEENTSRKRDGSGRIFLVAKCPYCGREK
jgi:hypothetical protein